MMKFIFEIPICLKNAFKNILFFRNIMELMTQGGKASSPAYFPSLSRVYSKDSKILVKCLKVHNTAESMKGT